MDPIESGRNQMDGYRLIDFTQVEAANVLVRKAFSEC